MLALHYLSLIETCFTITAIIELTVALHRIRSHYLHNYQYHLTISSKILAYGKITNYAINHKWQLATDTGLALSCLRSNIKRSNIIMALQMLLSFVYSSLLHFRQNYNIQRIPRFIYTKRTPVIAHRTKHDNCNKVVMVKVYLSQ